MREIVANALMHRGYGPHAIGTPVRLVVLADRVECWNPGGIFGGLAVDDLGRSGFLTRNPTLVSLLEIAGVAENRHSGVPAVREAMLHCPAHQARDGRVCGALSPRRSTGGYLDPLVRDGRLALTPPGKPRSKTSAIYRQNGPVRRWFSLPLWNTLPLFHYD